MGKHVKTNYMYNRYLSESPNSVSRKMFGTR